MSVVTDLFRVTPDELARARRDPAWALVFVRQLQEARDVNERPTHAARNFPGLNQTWGAMDFLLKRAEFPVDVVFGEQPLYAEDLGPHSRPERFVTADQVELAADAIAQLTYDDLIRGVEVGELDEAGAYPSSGWNSPEDLEWPRESFEQLAVFLRVAATAGDALIIWNG